MNFNHANGCQQCLSQGEYSVEFHRMSFPEINKTKRTNEMFRMRKQKAHHKENSLLEELDIDMIADFPTSDALHLIDLGVTKRCLTRWVYGMKGYSRKWNQHTVQNVSSILGKLNGQMPSDMHRAIRPLDTLKYWKGLEYRNFLLYIGIVTLKDNLCSTEYIHFLLLYCAVTICSSNVYRKFIPLAKQMFDSYVKNYILIYGRDTISSNIHYLSHITEDMQRQHVTNLMDLSTYKYENALRMMGLNLKHCNLPLEQIARRIIENIHAQKDHYNDVDLKYCYNSVSFIPRVQYEFKHTQYKAYSKIEIRPGIFLSNKKCGDRWILTKSLDIIRLKYIIEKDRTYIICGEKIKEKKAFFESPLNSTKIHVYMSDGAFHDELYFCDINSVMTKLVCLSYNENIVFIPILHALESFNE